MAWGTSGFVQAELHTLLSQGYSLIPTCLSPTLLTRLSSEACGICILVSQSIWGLSSWMEMVSPSHSRWGPR